LTEEQAGRPQRPEFPGRRAVGPSVRPLGWDDRTAGRAVYVGDLDLGGVPTGVSLRSPHEFARIPTASMQGRLSTCRVCAQSPLLPTSLQGGLHPRRRRALGPGAVREYARKGRAAVVEN
jgi:hypothetical protein